jgi:hypothetical protein
MCKIKTISFLTLFLSFSLSWALPVMENDLAEFSCMVTKGSDKARLDTKSGFCSGTFISKTLFLTAAHCLQGNPKFMGPQDQIENFFISCPGNFNFKIMASLPNKAFYSPEGFNSFGEFQGTRFTNRENDIAVLLTEENSTPSFPRLPKSEETLNDCAILGYSKYKCDRDDGTNCYRSVRFSSNDLLKNKLFQTIDQDLLSLGDSGSGVICKDNNEQLLMGIYVSAAINQQIVNIKNHTPFLEKLLAMTSEQVLKESELYRSSKEYLRYYELYQAERTNPTGVKINCSEGVKCLKYYELNEILKQNGIHEKLTRIGITQIMIDFNNMKIKRPVRTALPEMIKIGPNTKLRDFESKNIVEHLNL